MNIPSDTRSWLNHYQEGVPESLDYEELTMVHFLERAASRYGDRSALVFQGYSITYSQLMDMVDRLAASLADFGIRKGDRVAILLPNVIPCVAAYFAILKIGGIAVMNNPLYTDRELDHQLNDSGAKILITLDLLANRMIDLRPKTRIRQIIVTSIGDYLPFPKNLLFPLVAKKKKLSAEVKSAEDVYRWKPLLAGSTPSPPDVSLSLEDTAMYQYTGGTTGVSKGVMLSHGNLSRQAQQLRSWFPGFTKEGVAGAMLGALPFFHVFGLSTSMNLCILSAWSNILVPKPQPDQLMEAIVKFRPKFVMMVPTMFIGLLNHPEIDKVDMTCIEGCFSGSAPLPAEVIRDFEKKTAAVIVEGYGLTESCPVTHINPMTRRKVGSIGIPVPDTDCRIVDLLDGKTELPQGEPGELIVKGPQVMQGYWNNPEETAQTLRDGWLHTGDIARMDEDGYFFILDRKKDMIISGGFNIYPRDIEEVLFENHKILEATAIGIPHPSRGEQVKVFVVLKEGCSATEEEIISFCRERLAVYKLPTMVEFRTELPKTNVGKILKNKLRN